ncbi:MAG: dihydropteroate synthase [Puniceicoccales bacterium]|nr:dihydropteroate synthase [Puniceicoccales bacterium]
MKKWTSPHGRALPSTQARTLLMGIVNVTPDSFSDGGKFLAVDAAVAQATRLAADGADVLDLGAESTRPGGATVDTTTELDRLLPALRAVREALPHMPLSVDTYKAAVAEAAIAEGADIINDVRGGLHGLTERHSGERSPMGIVAARTGAPLVLMHNRGTPLNDAIFWKSFLEELQCSITHALEAGVAQRQLWLDPGFGFGKTPAQNLECLRKLSQVADLGLPVLLGTSRKSTLGLVLDAPVLERHEGNTATVVWGIANGAAMVRVHDIAAIRPAVRMADAIRAGLPGPLVCETYS